MLKDADIDFALSFESCRLYVKKSKLKQALVEIDRQVETASDEHKSVLLHEKITIKRQLDKLGAAPSS